MARYQVTLVTSSVLGLGALGIMPSLLAAQTPGTGPPPVPVAGTAQAPSPLFPSRAHPSGARTIAIHAAVGTGAGLVLGLVGSGASVGDDRTSVVVTWTALGAAAGVVSGLVTWLVGRRH